MEAEPKPPPDDQPGPPPEPADDPSAEVAETTSPVHFEGKGLNHELEDRHDRG